MIATNISRFRTVTFVVVSTNIRATFHICSAFGDTVQNSFTVFPVLASVRAFCDLQRLSTSASYNQSPGNHHDFQTTVYHSALGDDFVQR